MSRHHVAAKWSTDSPKFRKIIEPMLPQPCISPRCKRGGVVHRSDTWHVGHRPGHDQRFGKRATLRDVGPCHAGCNLSDGGKVGAALTNAKRRSQSYSGKGIRAW